MGNNLHMVLIAALFCCPTVVDATEALPPLPQETYRALSSFEKRIMAAQEQAVQDQAAQKQAEQDQPALKTIPARRRRHVPSSVPVDAPPMVVPPPKTQPSPAPIPLPPKRGKIK